MTRMLAAAALMTFPASHAAAESVCGREITTFEKAAAEIEADETFITLSNSGPSFFAYREHRDGAIRVWFVTKPSVQEVRAIVCRATVPDGERRVVKVEARCFGPKRPCNAVVEGFRKQ